MKGYVLVGVILSVFFITKGSIETSQLSNRTELDETKIKKAIWSYLINSKSYPDLERIKGTNHETFMMRNQHMARNYLMRIKPFAGDKRINSARFMRLMLEYKL